MLNMNNKIKILLFVFLLISVAIVISILSLQFFAPKQNLSLVNNGVSKNPVQGTKMEEKVLDENKQAVESAQAQSAVNPKPVTKEDNIVGKQTAKVQMIIYSDFECPFCLKFFDTLKQVRSTYKDQVSIAFRHFPLLTHANALPAALASECAGEQGKFWEMHDMLFAGNKNNKLNPEQYKLDARNLKLDIVKFSQCYDTQKYKSKVQEDMLGGRNSGVTGTPTIFINNEIYPGAVPFEDFTESDGTKAEGMKSIIERLLK
jgi:protein-disulfide isomerase